MLDHPLARPAIGTVAPSDGRVVRYEPARSVIISRLAVVTVLVPLISGVLYPLLPRSYTATADLLIRPTDQQGARSWDQTAREALDDNAITTKVDILRTAPLVRKVIDEHSLTDDPEFNTALRPSMLSPVMAALRSYIPSAHPPAAPDHAKVEANVVRHLVVNRERKSYLLQVGFVTSSPEKSAALTNSLVQAFVDDEAYRESASHVGLMKAFEDRVKALETRYREDEQVEFDFAVSSGLLHQGLYESIQEQNRGLSNALAQAHEKTVALDKRAAMLLHSLLTTGVSDTTEALGSPLLQALRRRYIELSTGVGSTGIPIGANRTVIEKLSSDIETETKRLVTAARADAAVAAQTEADLQAEIYRLDARQVRWLIDSRKRDDLHRAVLLDLDALNGANQRYMQEAGRGDQIQADVEVLSPADIPVQASFPKLLPFLAGTLALVIVLDCLILLPTLMRRKQSA